MLCDVDFLPHLRKLVAEASLPTNSLAHNLQQAQFEADLDRMIGCRFVVARSSEKHYYD